MLTRCPQCETIFRVSKKHISAAKGLVRCGSCKDVFNAKEHVIKSKKDLKKPATETKPTAQVTTTAKVNENKNVEKKSNVSKETAISEPDSFDFMKDAFISSGAFKKFDSVEPTNKPPQTKKPISKAEALERGKASTFNFNSVFNDQEPDISGEEAIIIKKPATPKNNEIINETKTKISTPDTKTLPAHQTVEKPDSENKSDKSGNFISQNVFDIKNAFSSISKKITGKVSSSSIPKKQSDEIIKKSLENKLNKSKLANQIEPAIIETKTSNPDSVIHKTQKKPAVMSINSETDIFSSSINTTISTAVKTTTSNDIKESYSQKLEKTVAEKPTQKIMAAKTKPKLKEDAALKLAIQLKKAAQEKNKSDNNKKSKSNTISAIKKKKEEVTTTKKEQIVNDKSLTESKKAENILTAAKKSKPTNKDNKLTEDQGTEKKLQVVDPETRKQTEQKPEKEPSETKEKLNNKNTKTAEKEDSKLIPKEDSSIDEELEDDPDGELVHIHMQTVDIPLVLRESLEELDLPARSVEMTIFMVFSLFILFAGLLLQFSVFRSIEVQQKYPSLKPLITTVCKTFTCEYSGPRDIKKIQLISRDIRVHPTTKGALLISATIVNNAKYQQPYPNFSVKLSSLSGKTVAQRFFSPKDYLGKLSKKLLLMPPKQPIRIALEVVDPGKEAINFEFKFLSGK
ncbi:MAG: DUF3426 domain-containing protein [Thiohalomonadales bacterium]